MAEPRTNLAKPLPAFLTSLKLTSAGFTQADLQQVLQGGQPT
jgi:hypothetical protein